MLQSYAVAELRPVAETHISEKELCRLTGKSAEAIKRWRRIGYGPPFIRVGCTPLYSREAVAAFLGGTLDHHSQQQP